MAEEEQEKKNKVRTKVELNQEVCCEQKEDPVSRRSAAARLATFNKLLFG